MVLIASGSSSVQKKMSRKKEKKKAVSKLDNVCQDIRGNLPFSDISANIVQKMEQII